MSDKLYTIWYIDRRKSRTILENSSIETIKNIATNRVYSLRESNISKTGTFVKSSISNTFYTIGNMYGSESYAATKSICPDTSYTIRNKYGREPYAVFESLCPDTRYTAWDRNVFEFFTS